MFELYDRILKKKIFIYKKYLFGFLSFKLFLLQILNFPKQKPIEIFLTKKKEKLH